MNTNERYMRIALGLARKAEGLTNPNPLVGALVVKNGRIMGKGYHERRGLAHAEVNALRQAGRQARGATLYVTLEPCDHFGKTPPCTDAIIASSVKKVVVAMKDPNPVNNGKGIARLRKAGIKIELGISKEDAIGLNKPYIKFITKRIPYITVKIAQSLDGKIAARTGQSKWITSEDARRRVHEIRGAVDAVMIGANTAMKDDPLLLSKSSGQKQPVRIVVDSRLALPPGIRLFSTVDRSPVIIATTSTASQDKIRLYEKRGAKVLRLKSRKGNVDLADLARALGNMEIMHVLAEGGGELVASLLEEKLVDRILVFIAPKIIGGRDAVTSVEGAGVNSIGEAVSLKNMKVIRYEKDILVEAEVSY